MEKKMNPCDPSVPFQTHDIKEATPLRTVFPTLLSRVISPRSKSRHTSRVFSRLFLPSTPLLFVVSGASMQHLSLTQLHIY